MLSLALSLLSAAAALARPSPQANPPFSGNATTCPEVFAIYLGPGNDTQNRTWYFRELGEGSATRLSAIPDDVTLYRLSGTKLIWDSDTSIYLNSYDDDRTYIMPASDALKAEHEEGWGEVLGAIDASIDPATCEITMVYKDNQYLQRYGFNVHLTPTPTGGQIQWGKPTAVPQPVVPEAAFARFSKGVPCEEAYYLEPCPA